MGGLTAARAAARMAVEKLFEGSCVITGYQGIKNQVTKEMETVPATLYSGACRVSKATARANQTESTDDIDYDAVIFLSPGAIITAGCKITVTQYGVTAAFEQAGEPSVYATHIEVKARRVTRA